MGDKVWPIITNPEALAVSQSWFGHPGTLADQDKDNAGQQWQIWAKAQGGGAVAVLLISRALGSALASHLDLSLRLSDYVSGSVQVRDIWNRKDLGRHSGVMTFPNVQAHDSMFLLLTPSERVEV